MGRKKSEYKLGETPVFNFYKNRKTYFKNSSRYVSHAEVREIIAGSGGIFEITGIEKEKFLMKILSSEVTMEDTDLLFRSVMNGGFVNYIRYLENVSGVSNMAPKQVSAPNSLPV